MKTSFLQDHYNRYRDAGGDHAVYVVANDLSRELGHKLYAEYEALQADEDDLINLGRKPGHLI